MFTWHMYGTHADHDARLIESSASFHMNPHREWFCQYEKYNGTNVFLEDNLTTKAKEVVVSNYFSKMERL